MAYASIDKTVTAYEIAVKNGFKGSEATWVESLKGESAWDIAVKAGFKGTREEFIEKISKIR